MRKLNKKNKKWNDNHSKTLANNPRGNRQYIPNKVPIDYKLTTRGDNFTSPLVFAPTDLRLLQNTEDSVKFFNKIRSKSSLSRIGKVFFVSLSFKNVKNIDYSSLSALNALIVDLKSKNISTRFQFPDSPQCREAILESGILDEMFDNKGKSFKKAKKSEHLFFEKGSKRLTREDNKRISQTLKNVMKHLTGKANHYRPVRTILLEICGNSIEWGGTKHQQWLLGVKYEESEVIFTITDVGKGILTTLHKKFRKQISDLMLMKQNDKILERAFLQKYGSSTQEPNRNKGLPAIKKGFDEGKIKNLKVLTNNVILHFDDDSKSTTLSKKQKFNGTLYRWSVTKDCLNQYIK